MASSSENTGAPTEDPQAPPPPQNPSEMSAGGEEVLERAQELFDRGSKAVADGDFVEALDCLSRALEIRVAHYGDLAPECASTYYNYGVALLYKYQEESPAPSGIAPKTAPKEDDLEHSWKMLDIARVIVEKSPDNTLLKAKIFSALGEASLEKEEINTSLSDYSKALAILEQLGEPDHRQIVEVNFRICLVYELACKTEDAIPYCEKAISSCKSCIQRLKNSKDVMLAGKDDSSSAAEGGSEKALEDEIESLTGILSDLERKLEDLKDAMSTPSSALDDIMKTVAMRAAHEQEGVNAMARAASFTTSRMATSSNGFDSSTMSATAATGSTASTVTDLGVVGRGVKRASIKPVSAEPSSKKPALDSPSSQVDRGNEYEVLTAHNGNDPVSK